MKKVRTAEEIKQAYEALPSEIKAIIDGPELVTLIPTIGAKHQLHVDQMGVLEGEITDVLVGFEETKNFSLNLVSGLGVERIKADAIAQDVNDLLFSKIHHGMQKTYEATKAEPRVISTPNPVPPAPPPAAQVPEPPKGALGSTPANDPAQTTSAVHNPALKEVDTVLSEPTVSKPTAPSAPTPKNYTTDPYRELPN